MGLTLPMIITVERLVVIFLPMSFDRVITPTRTWLAVVGVAVYWLSIFSYTSFWQVLEFDVDNMTKNLFTYSAMVAPPIFTVAGSLVISVRIQMISSKRKSLTSTIRSTNQTTKTLLAVNAVYCFTAVVMSLPLYIPEYASYSLTDEKPSNIGRISYQLQNIAVCLNSSSNFVVYVVFNSKFRDTLKGFFQWCEAK
ncbi:uncharacterized protein LOC106060024 [Biomphalaria glabrata]|uniref:Uncharacterized protein LOC106060024 n=1 Tax=Biomphalaria glabrata TaxID=6526 RepID=A0A9W3AT16_BIOGL|nr:uncharacterized protein LOC106060024 [Biomphalaria glabrata]